MNEGAGLLAHLTTGSSLCRAESAQNIQSWHRKEETGGLGTGQTTRQRDYGSRDPAL